MNTTRLIPSNTILIRVSKEQYENTLHFYRDILLLETEELIPQSPEILQSTLVYFGQIKLLLESTRTRQAPKICLNLRTEKLQEAKLYLEANGINEVKNGEPESGLMLRVSDPAGHILMINEEKKGTCEN